MPAVLGRLAPGKANPDSRGRILAARIDTGAAKSFDFHNVGFPESIKLALMSEKGAKRKVRFLAVGQLLPMADC